MHEPLGIPSGPHRTNDHPCRRNSAHSVYDIVAAPSLNGDDTMTNGEYIEIRLDKATGDITVIDGDKEIEPEEKKDYPMPLKNLGTVQSLDVAVIYHASPGCIWYRGRLRCW